MEIQKQEKVSESFDRWTLRMESTANARMWERIFPPEMPATHVFRYSWEGPFTLVLEVVEKSDPATTPAAQKVVTLPMPDLQERAAELGIDPTGVPREALAAKVKKASK